MSGVRVRFPIGAPMCRVGVTDAYNFRNVEMRDHDPCPAP